MLFLLHNNPHHFILNVSLFCKFSHFPFSSCSSLSLIAPQLHTKSVDLSLGMFSKTPRRAQLLSTSVTYAQSSLVMIVPPGHQHSEFAKLFTAFDEILWYTLSAITLCLLLITLIITKHHRLRHHRSIRDFVLGSENRTPVLNIVNTIVGLPWHAVPRRNFSRFLYTMLMLMWLIFRSLYQAVLYKNLQSSSGYDPPVQTLNESLSQDFIYFMLTSTQENIVHLPELYSRAIIVSRKESDDVIRMSLTDPDTKAAYLAAEDIVKYANKVHLYGETTTLVICPEPLFVRQYGIYYQHNSFLASLFDDTLLRLVDSGLIGYWRKRMLETAAEKVVNEPKKLTFEHLVSAFDLLFVCLGLSTVVFVIEFCSVRWKRMRKFSERNICGGSRRRY